MSRLVTLLADDRLTLPSLRAWMADPALGVVEWFCAHDVASMATTYTGVTAPVVGGGGGLDAVGRMYGQSSGYALGPNLLTNGDFSSGTTGWFAQYGATLSVVDGKLAVTATTQTEARGSQVPTIEVKRFYFCASDLQNGTGVAQRLVNNGIQSLISTSQSNVIRVETGLVYSCRTTGVGLVGYFDNCVVKLINGYHAEVATESLRPRLVQTGNVKSLFNTSGQGLIAYVPIVGTTCTIVYVPPGGAPVTVPNVPVTSGTVTLAYDHCALAILPSSATAEQIAATSAILAPLAYRGAA